LWKGSIMTVIPSVNEVPRGAQEDYSKVANAYLANAVVASESSSVSPIPIYEQASALYEEELKVVGESPALHALNAVCMEALAEAGAIDPAVAEMHIKRGLELAGDSDANIEDITSIMLVEAERVAANGDPKKAHEILDHLNGRVPREIIEELEENGVLRVSTVAKALLHNRAA
jgi:hypothetical protein